MDPNELVGRIAKQLGRGAAGNVLEPRHPPPRVADHELVRPIGAGSYGEVWLARSVTGQWRAVKVVARARFESDRPYEREYRGVVQFEPISRTHPGLIQVLHVGRDDAAGAFYYVMELADDEGLPGEASDRLPSSSRIAGTLGPRGRDLEAFVAHYRPRTLRSELDARGRLPVAEVVALGVHLSGALGHIHRHGLVHRDVKPSNVIVVRGQPKLADLGLVATTNEARSFVGTEGFIPPEGPGTVQADLFAFGRLLYEAATGNDRCEFPAVPPDLDTWPDREGFLELNEVLARLCAPEPSRRCAHAAVAAGDLNLLLAGRSVRKAYGVERRLQRATRITAVAAAAVVLALGIVGLQEVRQRGAEARASAERLLRQRAEAAERTSRQQLYTALLEQARATVRSGEVGQRVRALEAVRRAAAIRNTPELRREALAALALPDLRLERALPAGSRYTARQLDPAFERLAVCAGRGPVEIRAVADNRSLATLPASTNLMCYNASWSPDGRFLVVKRDYDGHGYGEDLELWDLSGDARQVLLIRDARRNVRAYHPYAPYLLTSDAAGRIVTWNLERGTEQDRRPLAGGATELLVYAPDGTRLAAIHPQPAGSVVSIYEATNLTLQVSCPFASIVTTATWHPDGTWLAVTDRSGTVHQVAADTGTARALGRHRAEAVTAVFDRVGDYLVTGGWERSLICWDLRTMQRGFVLELDSYQVQVRSDGRQWALLTLDGVQLHAFEPPAPREFAEDLGSRLRFAAFSADGRWLAAAADERLGVWDLGQPGPGALTTDGAEVSPYWSPDGQELFGSRRDEGCFWWRVVPAPHRGLAPGLERRELAKPAGFTWLSLAANQVAWTTTRGSQVVELDQLRPRDDGWSRTARGMNGISPDRRWLGIYQGYTSTLHVYQLPGLEPAAQLDCLASIAGFQFSPAGDEVAVASRGQVEFWNTRDWQRTRVLTNFAGIPHVGVLVQPDGRGWWLAPEQRFAGLYAAGSLEPRLPLPSTMAPLALSADGRQLAVSVEARRLQVWDLVEVRRHLHALGLDWADPGSP
jgi:serine/threonine protein kinase/WD40 repeat protein